MIEGFLFFIPHTILVVMTAKIMWVNGEIGPTGVCNWNCDDIYEVTTYRGHNYITTCLSSESVYIDVQ